MFINRASSATSFHFYRVKPKYAPESPKQTTVGNNVPHIGGPGSGSDRSSTRPLALNFGLTVLEERRYVAGVLRRLLCSFPGAHGCRKQNLELSMSRVVPPQTR